MSGIDPVEYGKLISKVDHLEAELTSLRGDVKALLELANQSRGGLWVGMSLAATFGGVVTWVTQHLLGR